MGIDPAQATVEVKPDMRVPQPWTNTPAIKLAYKRGSPSFKGKQQASLHVMKSLSLCVRHFQRLPDIFLESL